MSPFAPFNAAALSAETVAPWIAPARSAATRDCSSVITLNVIESRYGSPAFQKLGFLTNVMPLFGTYGPLSL